MTTKKPNHLAAIHIAQKALGLSTDDAAALKLAVTGKSSAANMSEAQRRKYLAHLSKLQQAILPRRNLLRSASDSHDARWTKTRALWSALANAGVVKVNTDTALNAYIKRHTKCDAWRFLSGQQINDVIESLKRWCAREKVLP